jgi:phosphohistidine phosphatase SixA
VPAPRAAGPPGAGDAHRRPAWQTGGVPVLLIRHAHAGSRRDSRVADQARRLSTKGYKQARNLTAALDGFSPQRILSSAATRCRETVAPLAESIHVHVELEDALAEGTGLAALALVRKVASEKIALCTHGDVIAEILVALADEDHLDLGPHPRQAKGSVWVLEAEGGRFVKAAYLAPPS